MRSEKARQRRVGLSLVETLALGLGMVGLLAGVAGATRYVRDELKTTQTRALLGRLEEAVRVYCGATGMHPPLPPLGKGGRGEGATGKMERGGEGERGRQGEEGLIAALRRVAGAREVLERAAREMPGMIGENTVRDAWGNELRCLTAESRNDADRQAVAAHGGGPIFVSAGSDGEGGEEIRSDELTR